jgi:hypothetical protein
MCYTQTCPRAAFLGIWENELRKLWFGDIWSTKRSEAMCLTLAMQARKIPCGTVGGHV